MILTESAEKWFTVKQNESTTSTILFFCASLTFPARQQRERALWIMNLLDLKLGSLKSFGPANTNAGTRVYAHPCVQLWAFWQCIWILKNWEILYLCIPGQARFHWNQCPSLYLRSDLPIYLVSHILKVNQDGCWRNVNQWSNRSSPHIFIILENRLDSQLDRQ